MAVCCHMMVVGGHGGLLGWQFLYLLTVRSGVGHRMSGNLGIFVDQMRI